jgi:ABC-type multidrug transport system permease subunit
MSSLRKFYPLLICSFFLRGCSFGTSVSFTPTSEQQSKEFIVADLLITFFQLCGTPVQPYDKESPWKRNGLHALNWKTNHFKFVTLLSFLHRLNFKLCFRSAGWETSLLITVFICFIIILIIIILLLLLLLLLFYLSLDHFL